jgi:hypothetical protein
MLPGRWVLSCLSTTAWTRGVEYLPDFYTDFYDENCKQ